MSYNPATPVGASSATEPSVRLAVGSMHERAHRTGLQTERLPALLVSYAYLQPFLKNRHRYRFRDWVMDSGAFTAANSGKTIVLADYMAVCHRLMAGDPTLVEIFALDVIGNPQASAANCAAMWADGIPAIPCYHWGEPEAALLAMAERYPKIAIGGVAYKRGRAKIQWAEQVFARVWPKRVHGFAFASEASVMALPFHSVDASSCEIGACWFGNWKQFGHLTVRGSKQDLRGEVDAYLDLEGAGASQMGGTNGRIGHHRARGPVGVRPGADGGNGQVGKTGGPGGPVGRRQGTRPRRTDGGLMVPSVTTLVYNLLQALGHDPKREGLVKTPERVARFYQEFLGDQPLCPITTFDAEGANEMVVVRAIPFYAGSVNVLPCCRSSTVILSAMCLPNGSSGCPRFRGSSSTTPTGSRTRERLAGQVVETHCTGPWPQRGAA